MPHSFNKIVVAIFLFVFLPEVQSSQDHFLVIGGGYSPSGNQVSLEKNVIFFRKLLSEKYSTEKDHDLYFADGTYKGNDIQYMVPMDEIPKSNFYMALLFGTPSKLNLKYRNSKLDKVDGVFNNPSLDKWFENAKSKIQDKDRLFIYVTAHGGKSSDKDNKYNTKLYLWGGQYITAEKLASHIEKLPPKVDVVMVMVQCFSGGFSHLIFDKAQESNKSVKRNICGFFSTVHTRVAAGCTPDINEENYDEYSSHFWAAIRGKNRLDHDVPPSDINGDGEISFSEAHAYTLIHSNNIDIPVKTTDAWLRKYSKSIDKKTALYSDQSPYYTLLEVSGINELAVLDSLSHQLNIQGLDKLDAAKKESEKIQKERKKLAEESKKVSGQMNSAKSAVRKALQFTWPELYNVHSPEAITLLTTRQDAFIKKVESLKAFKDMMKFSKKRSEIESKRLSLDKKWAKFQRFIRTIENVAFEANLMNDGDTELVQNYQNLRNMENSFMGVKQPAVVAQVIESKSEESAPKQSN